MLSFLMSVAKCNKKVGKADKRHKKMERKREREYERLTIVMCIGGVNWHV